MSEFNTHRTYHHSDDRLPVVQSSAQYTIGCSHAAHTSVLPHRLDQHPALPLTQRALPIHCVREFTHSSTSLILSKYAATTPPPVNPLRLSKGVKKNNLKTNEKSKKKVNKIKQMKRQRRVKNENQLCVCAPARESIMRRENKKRREMKA